MKPLKTRLGFIVFQCKYAVLRYCRQAVFERPYNGRFASHAAFPARRNNPKNHYDVMKLLPTATQREIKSAYYELSRIYHPDLNSSAEARERFAELTLAYNTLSRLETRREYDKQIGTYYMTRSLTRKSEGERVLRLMDDLVEIDATGIEQTSSFLGAGIPLNTILGLPVRLNNIHGPKASYGLQPHDVRMLHLLRQMCSGTLVASKGSSTVTFLPGDLQAGIFSSEGGHSGSVSLLAESALPCLALAPEPVYSRNNILNLKGITHLANGLHMDFFDKVYRPIVEKFGFHFSIEIKRRSYFPQSSGKVVIRSFPVTNLKAVDLTTPGRLVKITGWTSVAGAKPIRIAQVMSKLTRSALKDRFPGVDIYVESLRERDSRVDGTGQAVMILGETSSGMMLSGTALWRRGMSNEEVVQKAVNMFTQNSSHSICVDSLVQDKLLPYMALAKGQSSIRTSLITPHTKAAIAGLEAMSKVKFQVTSDVIGGSKTMVISCNGLGITR